MLRDQWAREVEKLFGIKPGIIGSGEFNIDSQIVIGNVQTVTKIVSKISSEFGTLILDEAHHVPADTFSKIIDGFRARYRIALSGTVVRKDGKHVLFKDYFGHTIYKPKQANTINPTIKVFKTGISLLSGATWIQKMNHLLYDPEYQDLVALVANRQIAKGHKVLVVGDRLEFLHGVYNRMEHDNVLLVTGGASIDDRIAAENSINDGTKNGIIGSRQIFAEGISINGLSCLILPVPINNDVLLEQLCGRVMRIHPEKLNPLVVDFHFAGLSSRKQNNARLGFYLGKGWEIEQL